MFDKKNVDTMAKRFNDSMHSVEKEKTLILICNFQTCTGGRFSGVVGPLLQWNDFH